MAASKEINLKVFFKDDVRRLTVDESACTSFLFMKEKLQTVFPSLRGNDFKVTWKDSDGDEITVSSDEDLITAFTEMTSNVKVLYVSHQSSRPNWENFQFGGNRSQTGASGGSQSCPFGSRGGIDMKGLEGLEAMAQQYLGPILGNTNNNDKKQSEAKASTDNQNDKDCPFSNSFDLKDIHALGTMARQHLGPLLETLNTPAQGATPSNSQEGLFMDILRNAAEGFFGNNFAAQPQQGNTKNAQQEASTSNASTSNASTSNASTSNASTSNASTPQSTSTSTTSSASQPKSDGESTKAAANDPKIQEGLKQLQQMGFSNNNGFLTHLLECFEGNVSAAVKALTDMKMT